MELSEVWQKEAARLLKNDPPDTSDHGDLLLFVGKDATVRRISDEEGFHAGLAGHFSVAPVVIAIRVEISKASDEDLKAARDLLAQRKRDLKRAEDDDDADDEDLLELENDVVEAESDLEELEETEETISLEYTTDWSTLINEENDFIAGAFVFLPTKDGTENMQKAGTLHSTEDVREFMERWQLLE